MYCSQQVSDPSVALFLNLSHRCVVEAVVYYFIALYWCIICYIDVCQCVCKCAYVRSPCFLIFSVTVSPACCSRLMASLRGFPFRLLLLIARIRSPTWIAPVLQNTTTQPPHREIYIQPGLVHPAELLSNLNIVV